MEINDWECIKAYNRQRHLMVITKASLRAQKAARLEIATNYIHILTIDQQPLGVS